MSGVVEEMYCGADVEVERDFFGDATYLAQQQILLGSEFKMTGVVYYVSPHLFAAHSIETNPRFQGPQWIPSAIDVIHRLQGTEIPREFDAWLEEILNDETLGVVPLIPRLEEHFQKTLGLHLVIEGIMSDNDSVKFNAYNRQT